MGFDERNVPKVREPIRDPELRMTAVRDPGDVRVFEVWNGEEQLREQRLDEIASEHVFEPHPGWRGHLERAAR